MDKEIPVEENEEVRREIPKVELGALIGGAITIIAGFSYLVGREFNRPLSAYQIELNDDGRILLKNIKTK